MADGAGSGAWAKLTASQLTGTGNSFGGQLLHVRDERSSGTANSDIGTGTTWTQRVLNTSKTNEISSATLVSNQISLPAGTYYIDAEAPHFLVADAGHIDGKSKLYNITDSSDILVGNTISMEGNSSGVVRGVFRSRIRGRFTLAGTKTVEIRSIQSTPGSIPAAGFSTTEVYTDVSIWKIA